MTATDCHWLPMTANDCHWLPLTATDCHWLPMTATDCHWLYTTAFDCLWPCIQKAKRLTETICQPRKIGTLLYAQCTLNTELFAKTNTFIFTTSTNNFLLGINYNRTLNFLHALLSDYFHREGRWSMSRSQSHPIPEKQVPPVWTIFYFNKQLSSRNKLWLERYNSLYHTLRLASREATTPCLYDCTQLYNSLYAWLSEKAITPCLDRCTFSTESILHKQVPSCWKPSWYCKIAYFPMHWCFRFKMAYLAILMKEHWHCEWECPMPIAH